MLRQLTARALPRSAPQLTQRRSWHYKAPLREMQFTAEEVHDFQEHYKTLKTMNGAEATPDTVKEILEAMASFCENELWPLNETADKQGCKVEADPKTVTTVRTPAGFKAAYDEFTNGQWQGLAFPEQYGGANMP